MFCTEEGCLKKAFCRGMCRSHYDYARRNNKLATKKYQKAKGRVCTHKGCEKEIAYGGFCTQHYQRFIKFGNTSDSCVDMTRHKTLNQRLIDGAIKNEKTDCWEWKGRKDKGGYGSISINNYPHRVHRVSYETFVHKIIPKTLHVLHACDNPCCINPDHLFLGTNYDNMKDRNTKDRQAKGVMMPHAKLTDEKVKDIKKQFKEFVPFDKIGFSNQCGLIADKYNVSGKLIRNIYHGTAWKHVD